MMLKVEDLSFSYYTKKAEGPIFHKFSVAFGSGINVILGPNGAGKTTLLKAIFGLLDYDGQVWYGDENITKMRVSEKINIMSYLPQMDVESSSLTVLEMVLLGRLPELGQRVSDEDLSRVMQTLEALNILPLATKNVGELSGGQKKLVFIAQTLVREPRVILLDEPVNSLDLQKQLELCRLLQRIVREKGLSIVVVMHDINLAIRFADNIAVLTNNGRLYAYGTPLEVISKEMLHEVYGVVATIQNDENGNELKVQIVKTVTKDDDFTIRAPAIAGYKVVGYRMDGGSQVLGGTIRLLSVDADHTVIFVYRKDDGSGSSECGCGCYCGCAPVIHVANCSIAVNYYSCGTKSDCC